MARKVILSILDGWGMGASPEADASSKADTPVMDELMQNYPNAALVTHGSEVGLPEGQMGNSEVGHLNIGAGRIVFQELARINNLVRDNQIDTLKVLADAIDYAKSEGKNFHLMGLVSDGGIHSHIEHLLALIQHLHLKGVNNIFVHAFLDGRDTDPKSGADHLARLEQHCNEHNAQLVSAVGRYYAMDRDKRWERIKMAYDMLLEGSGKKSQDLIATVKESYKADVTDEFVLPITKVDAADQAIGRIEKDDVVFSFNFRTDRCRQITHVLTQQDMPDHEMKTLALHYLTMTNYDSEFKGVHVVLDKDELKQTLGEVVAAAGKSQLRIAETEKYPHVTFFLSGGREEPFEKEQRIMVPSPKVATYDLQPEMSAPELTDKLLAAMDEDQPDLIIANFANTDMVGHTGVFEAAQKAANTVDTCVGRLLEKVADLEYLLILIADHGNADFMINPDGSPNTAHSKNPVPIIVVDSNYTVSDGKLADLAPSILNLMEIKLPDEMTGNKIIHAT